ncbi:MAG: DNA polymerase III subunit alpha [Flavobacteriia bacterium]|nr:DNA polymerase III subunit alpha [Flavobacteriia bacterium]
MGSGIMNFEEQFSQYTNYAPPGVRLPKIKIESRYYKSLKISPDSDNFEFLRQLCLQGVKNKGIQNKKNKSTYFDRTKEELSILKELGFVDYILLNWDVLNYCHENNIPTGPGRGSAAGSLVLYLLGVTQVDPIEHDLFFERFVSKSRAKKTIQNGITYLDGSLLADVDNDIAYEHRQKVIKYIENKYPARTCKILTLNTLSSKLCIKECGKIVGLMTEQEVNEVSDFIPKKFGKVCSIEQSIEESEKFKTWSEQHKEITEIASKLEGLNKNTGVHPSGIAISYDLLEEICPLQKNSEGDLVSGYDMNWVAELMVKFDILGLRTLSVIYNTCERIGINPNDIDVNDSLIYKSLQDLTTPHGIFQIEADTDFRVCRKLKPRNLDELSAVIAIARPGALDFLEDYSRYRNTGEAQSVHELFDSILSYTAGIPLYQEQLMQMAVKLGFSLDEAEQLRRIVGKKKVEQMPEWQKKIENKVSENSFPEDAGDVLWKVAEDSANYSFNKSHSISYSILAAWTTYLKFKYPQDFFLSLLKMTKFEPSPQEEINKICQELPKFNFKLLPPDLAKSKMDFNKESQDLRFGLNSIKGVSEKSLSSLKDFRDSDTANKYDIFIAAKQAGLNIGILSSLIQAGALSSYKTNRPLLVLEAQAFNLLTDREKRNFYILGEKFNFNLLKSISAAKNEQLVGDDGRKIMTPSRFETFKKKFDLYKKIYEKNKKYESFANWYFESKLLGYSYTSRLNEIFSIGTHKFRDTIYFNSLEKDGSDRFIGTVTDIIKRKSRNGNSYIKMSISDEVGTMDAMMGDFGNRLNLSKYTDKGGKIPEKGNIVTVLGRKGEDILFASDINILDQKIYMKLSEIN